MSQCLEEILYQTQSYFTIKLDTKIDLTTADVKQIIYRKPNLTKGYWEATADGTVLEYDVQPDDIDMCGKWKFQSYIEVDGRKGFGQIVEKEFLPNIHP